MKILQLSNDSFLNYFNQDKLTASTITRWDISLGEKGYLTYIPPHSYDAILIDDDVEYKNKYVTNWFKRIKDGGALFLKATERYDIEAIIKPFKGRFEIITLDTPHLWGLKKLPFSLQLEHYLSLFQHIEKKEFNQAIEWLDFIELADDNHFLNAIREKIYFELGLEKEIEQIQQDYFNASSSHSAYIKYALSLLSRGNYYKGFQMRDKVPIVRTYTPPPDHMLDKMWKGESIENKTLVIWSEFGFGDEIMFAQLAYYLKINKKVQKIIFVTQPPLVSIFQTHPDIDQVINVHHIEQQLGEFDYWVYQHSILSFEPMDFKLLPKRIPYLFADPQKIAHYRYLFSSSENLKVGIAWRGKPNHENEAFRSIYDMTQLQRLFNLENIDWYCFQKDCNAEEKALLQANDIPHITEHFDSMADTAAALTHIDCLIVVDTGIAHLAGAMNIPTLLLLPYIMDWRWGHYESTNMWYPNMRLFRCNVPQHCKALYEGKNESDWESAITEVIKVLEVRKIAHANR